MSYEKVKPQGKVMLLAACGFLGATAHFGDKFLSSDKPMFEYDAEISKTEPVGMGGNAQGATVSFLAAAAALYGLGRKEDENDNRPIIKRMMDRVRD